MEINISYGRVVDMADQYLRLALDCDKAMRSLDLHDVSRLKLIQTWGLNEQGERVVGEQIQIKTSQIEIYDSSIKKCDSLLWRKKVTKFLFFGSLTLVPVTLLATCGCYCAKMIFALPILGDLVRVFLCFSAVFFIIFLVAAAFKNCQDKASLNMVFARAHPAKDKSEIKIIENSIEEILMSIETNQAIDRFPDREAYANQTKNCIEILQENVEKLQDLEEIMAQNACIRQMEEIFINRLSAEN